MEDHKDEEKLLRSVALQTANSILLARQRAEQELLEAKKALERRTQELAHSLAMMSATLESTTDGILVTNEHGEVTGFNQKFVEMWRIPEEAMDSGAHEHLLQVTGPQLRNPGQFRTRIKEIYSSSPAESFDVLELADGRVFERSSKLQCVDGRNVGRVWSFRDITERRRDEAERERLLVSEREARTRARLQQVLWNLLTNALKFTPKGGRVEVFLQRRDSQLQLSVKDSGQGISPDFLPHVFDRFRQADASTTREHRGLGLGLAIVKNLVELHGGTVRAESPGANQGSTFTIVLPIAATKMESHPAERGPRATLDGKTLCKGVDLTGVRILAVDDEADARQLVKRILTDCGATVEIVASAEEALQSFKAIKPDVLITDIGMPGEDGYGVIGKVRQLGAMREGAYPQSRSPPSRARKTASAPL